MASKFFASQSDSLVDVRIDGVSTAAGRLGQHVLRDEKRRHARRRHVRTVERLALRVRPGAIGVLMALPRSLGYLPELLGNLEAF